MGVIIVLVSALGLTGLLLWWSPGTTEPFLDADGHDRLPRSISQKLTVPINGVEQGMVIRGEDTANPVLLWVHGGPGMPDYFLTQQYPTDLADLFTVVWWDQRGAALSYDPDHRLTFSCRGYAFSRSFGFWDQFIRIDLRKSVTELQIPVYFLEGKYDYTCNTSLAQDYFEQLQAPVKGFYEFDSSAHSPLLEQPQKGHRILEHAVLGD